MRAVACVLFCFVSGFVACGGGTPPPKTDGDAVTKPTSTDAADAAAPVATEAPKEPPPPAAPPPAPEPPPAADDPWQAFHVMPSNDVLRTLKNAHGKVQVCIRAGLKRDPSESGEVKIKFVVTQKGEVLVWKDEGSSMTDEETTKCIGEVIKTLRFPQQKMTGNTLGQYSIHLQP
jgi:hypothetical protein